MEDPPSLPQTPQVVLAHVSVTFPHEIAAALADAALKAGLPRSRLVRQIVEEWLRAHAYLPPVEDAPA